MCISGRAPLLAAGGDASGDGRLAMFDGLYRESGGDRGATCNWGDDGDDAEEIGEDAAET